MSVRLANPAPQFFYNGTPAAPLDNGLMYFYVNDSTLTPKDTYSDNSLSTPNSNPVVLSASGVLPNVFLSGSYRVILKDKSGVTQWDRSSVNQLSAVMGNTWDSTITYGLGATNIVYASDGYYYVSLQANNLGHDPANNANPTWWQNEFDYLAKNQQIVSAGNIVIGDGTTGLTAITTKTKGTIAVGNGTTTATLAVGTNNQVLMADSAQTEGVKWAAPPSGQFMLVATLTPSVAANLDGLSVFSATYDGYLLVGEGLIPSADDALLMQFANAGVVDTGTHYAFLSGVATGTLTYGASTSIAIVSGSSVEATSSRGLNFVIYVWNVNSATLEKSSWGTAQFQNNAGTNSTYLATIGGYNDIAVSGVRFKWTGGSNFTASGKVRIYGLANS